MRIEAFTATELDKISEKKPCQLWTKPQRFEDHFRLHHQGNDVRVEAFFRAVISSGGIAAELVLKPFGRSGLLEVEFAYQVLYQAMVGWNMEFDELHCIFKVSGTVRFDDALCVVRRLRVTVCRRREARRTWSYR
jgi:hypothetical protein